MKKSEWDKERKQWFIDNPADWYVCHYCHLSMLKSDTTLDHENNRRHKGRLLPCCFMDNARKGSTSHGRYVTKYYPDHECEGLGETSPPKTNI